MAEPFLKASVENKMLLAFGISHTALTRAPASPPVLLQRLPTRVARLERDDSRRFTLRRCLVNGPTLARSKRKAHAHETEKAVRAALRPPIDAHDDVTGAALPQRHGRPLEWRTLRTVLEWIDAVRAEERVVRLRLGQLAQRRQ